MKSTSTARAMAALLAEQAANSGLSQRQFADLIGSTAKHVNIVFNGKAGAHPITLDEWAECLGMSFVVTLEPTDTGPTSPGVPPNG